MAAKTAPGKVRNVEPLGFGGAREWSQSGASLQVAIPEQARGDIAVTLRIAQA
jgi:hypothetical protein